MRFVILALALAVASPAFAQPAPAGPGTAQPQDRREKIKKRIRALRAYTLTEELSLDEQTAGKLFPMLAKYDDVFDKLLATRADLQKRLVGSASIKDPKEIDKLIDDASANQRALWDTEDKRLGEMRKILTPAQVARVLVVLPVMERKIQNQLRKAAAQANRGQAQGDDDGMVEDPFADAPPAKRKGRKQHQGGELGGNPFSPKDPFSPAANKNQPCDPFSAKHSCKE